MYPDFFLLYTFVECTQQDLGIATSCCELAYFLAPGKYGVYPVFASHTLFLLHHEDSRIDETLIENEITEDLIEGFDNLEHETAAEDLNPIHTVQKASEDAHSKSTRTGYRGQIKAWSRWLKNWFPERDDLYLPSAETPFYICLFILSQCDLPEPKSKDHYSDGDIYLSLVALMPSWHKEEAAVNQRALERKRTQAGPDSRSKEPELVTSSQNPPSTTIPDFVRALATDVSLKEVLVISKVIRWIITPEQIDVSALLHPRKPWDLVNRTLLHPPAETTVPPLTSALANPRLGRTAQTLELSPALRDWASKFAQTRTGKGAVSMLNLLSFLPDRHSSYLVYGRAFAESIGSRHGGRAKLAGWDEFALAHYPSILHFADMLASDDYQAVNLKYRVPSLRDTCILCTSEIAVEEELLVARKADAKL
ncbi:hypothetical protein DV738_g3989, partial [Chaetothyriales sp. CBS 135597]